MCPEGYYVARTDNRFDCNDHDGSVQPGIEPNTYFTTPYCPDGSDPLPGEDINQVWTCPNSGATPSFDYNCDGTQEPENPYLLTQVCGGTMCNASGWISRVPECGVQRALGSCQWAQGSCAMSLIGLATEQPCR